MNIIKEISKKSLKEKQSGKKLNLLNKRYCCLEEVGRGGLSIVYKGLDIYSEYFEKDSEIVIKMPIDELLEKSDISAFVYSEYRYLRRLSLDNIVKILDFGIDKKSNIPYLVLEHIEGKLLSEISIVNMDKKAKNFLSKKLIETLKYIHNKNIVHGDISPTNIIIKQNNTPVIFDFGISQNINKDDSISLEYQKVKALNLKYCAPELISEKGSKPSIYTDIFSLAAILYELYANKPLFKESSEELLSNPINKRDLSFIPLIFRRWFKNALSLEAKNRYLPKKYIFCL